MCNTCGVQGADPQPDTHAFVSDDMCAQPHIGLLSSLTQLHVQHNCIHTLDERLGCCSMLRVLDISSNAITSLPYSMYALTLVDEFKCAGNAIVQPPVNYASIPFATLVRYWTQVKAATMQGLADVSQCALLRVPPEFMDAQQPLLRQVTTMILRDNLLVSLPVSMMCLSQLHTLDVSRNKLPELQGWIIDLPSLTNLNASYNELRRVPDDLGRGVRLQRLLLKGNTIEMNTAFWFENLTSLLELDISDNVISSLPVTIGLLTQLQILRVEGNPLRSPPLELVMRGMKDVLFYLQYNARYETSVRPQDPGQGVHSTQSASRRQIVAAAAAPAQPVKWEDCARASTSAQSTATYCLPYSTVQPHPPACALDGKKSSFYRCVMCDA